jgi:hypothetical protein
MLQVLYRDRNLNHATRQMQLLWYHHDLQRYNHPLRTFLEMRLSIERP